MQGRLEAIFTAPAAKAVLIARSEVLAISSVGLERDRYALGHGSFSRWPGAGRQVSLIEAESVEAVLAETGIDLREGRSRRNLVTRGIRLSNLVGGTFRIGKALFCADRLCQPCAFLDRLTQPGAFAALKGRGGLRADVLDGGWIRVGDEIKAE